MLLPLSQKISVMVWVNLKLAGERNFRLVYFALPSTDFQTPPPPAPYPLFKKEKAGFPAPP